jgi:hypothetical protein
MLAKKHDPFIDLKEKQQETAMPMEMKGEKPKPRGPIVYVRDINLPLTDEDLNTSLIAEVKLTPREIRTTIVNGEKKTSFDLEITGIRFKS